MTVWIAGWTERTMGELCLPVNKIDPVDAGRTEIRYVDIGSVDGERQVLSEIPVLSASEAPTRARQVLSSGDTVFSTVRPYLRKIAYIDDSLEGEFASTGFAVLRPGPEVLSRYLFYYATSPSLLDQVLPLQRGVSYPAVRDKDVLAARIPLPPIDEQRRIVEILEDHLSCLDAAALLLDRVALRSAKLASAGHRQSFVQLRDLHGTTPILDVAAIANGQTPKGVLDLVSDERAPDGLPYFKVGDMNVGDGRWMDVARNYLTPESAASVGLSVRPAGTVLIPKRGGAIATNKKRVLREAACYDLNTMGIVPGERLDSLYLWHWLVSIDLAVIADGSNVPQINAAQIRRLALPVPSLAEQRRTVQYLDRMDEVLAGLNAAVTAALQRGDQLRRALLAAAFTGRLTGHARDDEVIQELTGV